MNRPVFLLQGRALLLACILAMGMGACALGPSEALCLNRAWAEEGSEAAQAGGDEANAEDEGAKGAVEGADASEEQDEEEASAPVGPEQILAYLGSKRFALDGVDLSYDKDQSAKLQVVIAQDEVWVLDATDEADKRVKAIEDALVDATVKTLKEAKPQFGTASLQGKAFEKRVRSAVSGKLTEVRAYTLAHALAFYELAPTEAGAPTEQELKDARVIDVPASPLSVHLHWVVLPASQGTGQDGDSEAGASATPANQGATKDAAAPAQNTDAASDSQTPTSVESEQDQPAGPAGVQVEQQPSDPQPTQEQVWVIDQAAWDEQVVVNEAWDEQVWVPNQVWVANNVWVQDSPAWDEQVIVKQGYHLNVPARSYYLFKADGFKTYDDDEMERHIKELINEDRITNYEVKVEYEQVWVEPEYETVHHEEVGHWEDQGSYQDNGHYETVHHEAEYTTVHHDEVGHWE